MDYRIAVEIPQWLREWWWRFAYLVPAPGEQWREQIQIRPDDKFKIQVNDLMQAALQGEELPEVIAPTILNLTDDLLAGREITIRTGDYIALQNYMRKGY